MAARQPNIELVQGSSNTESDAFTALVERQRRIRLFGYTFLAIALVGLAYTWLRPAIYESSAILRAHYRLPDRQQLAVATYEQLVVHEQRLVSRSQLAELATALNTQGLDTETDTLTEMLHVEVIENSRLLSISAQNRNPDFAFQAVEQWTQLYTARYIDDQASASSQEQEALAEELQTLEQKISDKRDELEAYRLEHQIVSLERDESRVLNKMKALGASLDKTVEEKAGREAKLKTVIQASEEGKPLIRPQDQRSLGSLQAQERSLSARLRELAIKYTDEYMALDPAIVSIKNKRELIRTSIENKRRASQQAYLEEAKQAVSAAKAKQVDLQQQLTEFQQKAQTFSTHIEAYRSLTQQLKALEREAQKISAELLQQEVREPHQTRIQILEPPFLPQKPIGPPYWRDTGISLLAALIGSLLALFVYHTVHQRRSGQVAINIPLFTGLPANPPPQQLQQNTTPIHQLAHTNHVELQIGTIEKLLETANNQTKLAIGLMLTGISTDELVELQTHHIDTENNLIQAPADGRTLPLPEKLKGLIQLLNADQDDKTSFWHTNSGTLMPLDDLQALVVCAAHDAGFGEIDAISLASLRHSYLTYLVRQGLRLGQLEKVAGYIAPTELNGYRQYSPPGEGKALNEVELIYPGFS